MLSLTEAELKATYGRRYQMYVDLLRAEKGHQPGSQFGQTELGQMRSVLQALNSLDTYINAHKAGEVDVLRDRQFTVFEDIRNFLEAGGREGYVKLPTGFGKTVLFTELIEALNLRTMVVVPTKVLVRQTKEKLDTHAPDIDTGLVYSEAKEFGRQATITTYDSLIAHLRNGNITPDQFGCLILDEVHLSLSEQRRAAVRAFTHAIKFGFTATDRYSEQKGVDDLLDTCIHRMSLREGTEAGLLSSFSAIVARTQFDLSKVSVTNTGDYDEHELAKAVNIAARNQAAVELYQKNYAGQTAIAYCVGVEHATAVANQFTAAGVNAAVIHGGMSDTEQQAILAAYKRGDIMVLTNADLLIAGFDEPRASVCLNLRPTASPVIAEQRAGRVLRLNPNDPDKHAIVIDFLDQGIRPKNPPVLFAAIAGGTHVFKTIQERPGNGGGGGGGRKTPPLVPVDGLDVILDEETILTIIADQEKITNPTQQDVRDELVRLGITAADWVGMTRRQRSKIEVFGLKITAIARVFGIFDGDPESNAEVFYNLCRRVFGNADVDQVLREKPELTLHLTQQQVLDYLAKQGITAGAWLVLSSTERKYKKILGQTFKVLGNLFGVKTSGSQPTDAEFQQLCRVIFGDVAVDAVLREKPELIVGVTPEKIKQQLTEQGITAADWLSLGSTQRLKIKVFGLKITAIAKLYGLGTGRGLPTNAEFQQLCRAIFGDAEVDAALRDRKK